MLIAYKDILNSNQGHNSCLSDYFMEPPNPEFTIFWDYGPSSGSLSGSPVIGGD